MENIDRPMKWNHLPEILMGSEIADILRVDPKTVVRWAKQGRIEYFRTVGGHRRYKREDFIAAFNAAQQKDWGDEHDGDEQQPRLDRPRNDGTRPKRGGNSRTRAAGDDTSRGGRKRLVVVDPPEAIGS